MSNSRSTQSDGSIKLDSSPRMTQSARPSGSSWSPRRPVDPSSTQRSFGRRVVRLERSAIRTRKLSPTSSISQKSANGSTGRHFFPRASRWNWNHNTDGQNVCKDTSTSNNSSVHQAVDDTLGSIDPSVFSVKLFAQLGRQKPQTHAQYVDNDKNLSGRRRGISSTKRRAQRTEPLCRNSLSVNAKHSRRRLRNSHKSLRTDTTSPDVLDSSDRAKHSDIALDSDSKGDVVADTIPASPTVSEDLEEIRFSETPDRMTPEMEEDTRHQIEAYGMLIPVQNLFEGQLALSEYFRKYRCTKLDKRKPDMATHSGSDHLAARDGYLQACASDIAVPEPLGIVRRRPRHDSHSKKTVDLSHFGVGSKAKRLAAPLSQMSFVDSLKLRGNRLSQYEAVDIVQHLGQWVCHLDLANNSIGIDGASELGRVLSSHSCGIQTLSLEGNHLGDKGVKPIADSLSKNRSLRRLCLRGNDIGSPGCLTIASALSPAVLEHSSRIKGMFAHDDSLSDLLRDAQPNTTLEELDLSWNRIGGEGAVYLFRALVHYQSWFSTEDEEAEEAARKESGHASKVNEELNHQKHPHLLTSMESCLIQDLDISWNLVGQDEHSVIALVDMLPDNDSLIRFDISYNWFERSSLERIGRGLAKNHTLLDFFIEGSCAFIDAEGYLQMRSHDLKDIEANTEAARVAHILPPSGQNNKWLDLDITLNRRDKRWAASRNPGWIAGGWSEVTFEWSPGHHTDIEAFHNLEVDLRLSVDDFRPTRMKKSRAGSDVGLKGGNYIFTATRMMPPGDLVYFFTIEGDRLQKQETSIPTESPIKKKKIVKKRSKKRLWNLGQVIETINCIYDAKIKADAADDREYNPRDALPDFVHDWFEQEYGTVMKERKLGFFKHSVEVHSSKSLRVQWFSVLIGWRNEKGENQFSDFDTPYRVAAEDSFLRILSHACTKNAIEECLRAEPCLVRLGPILQFISEGPKHGGLFDLAYLHSHPYKTLVKALRDNAPAKNAAGRRLKKADRVIDFDCAVHFIMKAWFIRMSILDPKNTGTLSAGESSSSSSSSSSDEEETDIETQHLSPLKKLSSSGAFVAKNQPHLDSSIKLAPEIQMPISICNYIFCEERVGPLFLTGTQPRRPLDEPAVHKLEQNSWRLSQSVFAPRQRVCDGRDFIDSPALFARACMSDISRCRLDALLGPKVLQELRVAMLLRYDFVSKYIRIQMCRSESPRSFLLQDLEPWAKDSKGLLDGDFTMQDIFEIWRKIKDSSMDSLSSDEMSRSEFLELLVRISLKKFVPQYDEQRDKHDWQGSVHIAGDAFDTLCDLHLEMRIGNTEVEDPDEFRLRALYRPETDIALRRRMDIIKLCFASWARKMGQRLTYEEFHKCFFLRAMKNPVTSEQFSIMSEQSCRVAFSMSRMTIVDDQMHDSMGSRDASLVFTEFLECIAGLSKCFYLKQREVEEEKSITGFSGVASASSSPLHMQMLQSGTDEDKDLDFMREQDKNSKTRKVATMTPLGQMVSEFIDHILRPLVDEKSAKRRASVQARLRYIENAQINFSDATALDLKLKSLSDKIGHKKTKRKSTKRGKDADHAPHKHHHHHYFHDHESDSPTMSRQRRRRRASMMRVSEFGKASNRVVRCTGMLPVKDLQGASILQKGALVWGLGESVFAARKERSDAKHFYDTDEVRQKCFNMDFLNLKKKQRFTNLIDMYDDEGGADELSEVRNALWECYGTILDAFEYYSVLTIDSSTSHVIDSFGFFKFVDDCKIIDYHTCSRAAISKIFEVENLEEAVEHLSSDVADESTKKAGDEALVNSSQVDMNDANDDNKLMRFEFVGCLVRIAVEKYIKSGAFNDVSEALTALCDQKIDLNLGAEAIHDSNSFRRERLYLQNVDKIFVANHEHLLHLFNYFGHKCSDGPQNAMEMHEWLNFIEAAGLLGDDFEVVEAKLAFAWSQMAVADEIGDRSRFISLDFCDFLEAIARICDLKALPTNRELKEEGVSSTALFFDSLEEAGTLPDFYEKHPSEWNSKKTQSIAEKLPKLLSLIFHNLTKAGVIVS